MFQQIQLRNCKGLTRALCASVSCLLFVLSASCTTAFGQTQTFSRKDLEYVLVFPSTMWSPSPRPDVHPHVEFIYGSDPANGFLRLRKRLVKAGTTAGDLFAEDEKYHLSSLPGYVSCVACGGGRGTSLGGPLKAMMFSYEYSKSGVLMEGRIYYLEIDKENFYSLHFTGAASKLSKLQSDMDQIALSFRLK